MKLLVYLSILLAIPSLSIAAPPKDSVNHVFFLHNKIYEDMADSAYNNQYGKYEYHKIIDALNARGYLLYAEERPYGTDPDQYSWVVAKKIDSLLKQDVPPSRITVVGSGKGALITMLTSSHVRNNKVRYVVLSGCNELVSDYFYIDMHGTFLSVYENTDNVWTSCEKIKEASKDVYEYKEVALNTGLKNGYLYKPMDEWLQLVYSWVEM